METSESPIFSQEEEAQQDLAEDLILQGNFSKALEIYQSLLQSPSLKNSKGILKYAQFLNRISFIHYELCQFTIALEKCHESIDLKSLRNQDDDGIHEIENYKLFGMIYRAQAKYADALTNYKKCEEILLRNYPKNHYEFSDINYELGLFYSEHAQYETALNYFTSSVDNILTKGPLNPSDHVKMGRCYQEIGKIHQQKRLFQKAKDYYEKAKQLGLERLERARLNDTLGYFFLDTDDFDTARKLFEESLAIRLKHFEKHPSIAESYSGLSRVNYKENRLGDTSGALVYAKKALEMLKEFFDLSHPRIAISYQRIGDIHFAQDLLNSALENFSRAKEIFSNTFGKDSPVLALPLICIGSVYRLQFKYFHALEYYEESMANIIKNYGEDDYILSIAYKYLGLLARAQKDFDEASKYYKKALDIKLVKLEENDPELALAYENLGLALDKRGDSAASMESYKKALDIRMKQWNKNHNFIANAYYNMAIVSKNLGDYGSAVRYYQTSLKNYIIHWGPGHSEVVVTAFRIGDALKTLKKYDEAAAFFKIAYATQKKCKEQKTDNFLGFVRDDLGDVNIQQHIYLKNISNL